MIQVGEKLPQATFSLMNAEGNSNPTTEDLFTGKKVVLFAVPGAFTPTCSEAHLPGFIVKADEIKAKGVASIICLSVNDAFVMKSWGESQNAEEITMLADGGASFTKAIGLEMDTADFGGVRSQRYAMVVNDGTVENVFVEQGGEFKVSSADYVLENL